MVDGRKSVLITGCSPGGIGNSLAREFHSQGLRVFATARKAETLGDLIALGIEAVSLEVHKPESIKALKAEIEKRTGGRLDYLVNNAGRNYTVPALEVDFDEVRDVFDINVISVMRMCVEFTPLLIAAKGAIVQIGSVAAFIPYPFGSTYNAAKAALHAYSTTLRLELSPFDVKVITVYTGRVKSRLARTERVLAEDSLYVPVSEEYEARVKHGIDDSMPADAYSKSVVTQLLKTVPKGWIWEGKSSWSVWFMSTFFTRQQVENIFAGIYNFKKLRVSNNAEKKLIDVE